MKVTLHQSAVSANATALCLHVVAADKITLTVDWNRQGTSRRLPQALTEKLHERCTLLSTQCSDTCVLCIVMQTRAMHGQGALPPLHLLPQPVCKVRCLPSAVPCHGTALILCNALPRVRRSPWAVACRNNARPAAGMRLLLQCNLEASVTAKFSLPVAELLS